MQESEERSSSSTSKTISRPLNEVSMELEDDEEMGANILGLSLLEPSVAGLIYEASITASEESDSFSDATDDTPTNHSQPPPQAIEAVVEMNSLQPLQDLNRTMTAPPSLSLGANSPSKQRSKSPSPLRCSTTITESGSELSSSSDSFHSVQSWHSPLAPPSPPASGPSSPVAYPFASDNIVLPKRLHHSRNASATTLTPGTPGAWGAPDAEIESMLRASTPSPKTPPLFEDRSERSEEEPFEIFTPPTVKPTVRHRTTTSSNSQLRELSPLPPAETLFQPRRRKRQPRKLQTARHLPIAIIQKTYEILVSPPSHLFQLMLNIASKIAAGEWRGMLSGYGEPVSWDFEDEYGEDSFEDDYGISLPNARPRAKRSGSAVTGGSWEVD